MIEPLEYTYDLFVSYAEADRPWVEGYLLDTLIQAGVRYHSEAAFTLGMPRLLEFERSLRNSRRILLILTPVYLADTFNQFTDIMAQNYGLETATWPVIPLILKPVKLPPRLSMLTALNATNPTSWPDVIKRLSAALQFPLPGVAPKPSCPYPGMVPFSEVDSSRFFGRDQEIQELLARLRLHPFLAVIGPSGSGKSSLVFAGLIPALRQSSLFGRGEWLIRPLRPRQSPLATLTASLPQHRPHDQRLLLIIDSFEEIFTIAQKDAASFQQALLRLIRVQNCYVILTIRADFYSDLMTTLLWSEIQAHRLEVMPLSEGGLRQAIVHPAEDVGVFVETALVERLVTDAAGEPGVLPLVQETLVLLWERLERRFLPLGAYEALVLSFSAYSAWGSAKRTGLQVAMARRADITLADLTLEQQAMARRVFLRLVQFGEGRADTRRQQPITALQSAGDQPELFSQMLRHLTSSRLLTLSGEVDGTGTQVDLAHEALIAGWPTLQVWLRERREAEQTRRRLENKVTEWVRLGSSQGGLLDEVELFEAERWLASPDAIDLGYDTTLLTLVQNSRLAIETAKAAEEAARQRELAQVQALALEQKHRAEEQSRSATRLRWLVAALTTVFLLAVGAAILARTQTIRSERLRLVSITQALAAQAPRQPERRRQDERGALLARQAYIFNRRGQGQALSQIDDALRSILSQPFFSPILGDQRTKITGVAFSPDSQMLACARSDKIIWVWRLNQPKAEPIILSGHEDEILAVAFSPDNQTLASSSNDGSVRLWKVHQPEIAPTILRDREGKMAVFSIAFSSDGQKLASGSADGAVRLWYLDHLTAAPLILRELPGDMDILSVAFSPDGQMLASSGGDGELWLWDISQSEAVAKHLPGHESGIRTVAFSPDGQTLASGSIDRSVRLWNLRQLNAAPITLSGHTGEVWSVAFSPDGQTLASAGTDRAIRLWDLRQRDVTPIVLRGHEDIVRAVAFSPDGEQLASGGTDGVVRLWELHQSRAVPILLHEEQQIVRIAVSPDGQTLASASGYGGVRLWNLSQPDTTPTALPDYGPVLSVAFSPDSKTLASGSPDGRVFLSQVNQPDLAPILLPGHTDRVYGLAFSPDGRMLATASWDKSVHLWHLDQSPASVITLSGHTDWVWSVAFSPDNQILASSSADKIVRLWDLHKSSSSPTFVLTGHTDRVLSLAFSPDGHMLASGGADRTVRLWSLHQLEAKPVVLSNREEWVMSVSFSPDGQILAASSGDGTIRLWDLHQLNADPIILHDHQGTATSIAFSPDSRILASSGEDGNILLWIAQPEMLANMVCNKVWRNLTQEEWDEFIGADIPYERTCSDLPSGRGAPADAPVAIY